MFASRMNTVGLRSLPQALPSRVLQNMSKRSLIPESTLRPPKASLIAKRLSTGPRTFSSSTGSKFPRKTPRRLLKTAPRRLPPPVVAASFTLGFLYSLSWILEVPPHKFIPDMLFDAPDDIHTILDEDKLAAVSYPENFDFTNDHFFDTLSRAHPLKYGYHLRQAQEDIRKCREAVLALETTLREPRIESISLRGQEQRRLMEEELERIQEPLLFYKVRWLRLFILDQREGAWRTQPGFKRRTLESVVREWMGRDVENLVGELVRMGFIDVRAD